MAQKIHLSTFLNMRGLLCRRKFWLILEVITKLYLHEVNLILIVFFLNVIDFSNKWESLKLPFFLRKKVLLIIFSFVQINEIISYPITEVKLLYSGYCLLIQKIFTFPTKCAAPSMLNKMIYIFSTIIHYGSREFVELCELQVFKFYRNLHAFCGVLWESLYVGLVVGLIFRMLP